MSSNGYFYYEFEKIQLSQFGHSGRNIAVSESSDTNLVTISALGSAVVFEGVTFVSQNSDTICFGVLSSSVGEGGGYVSVSENSKIIIPPADSSMTNLGLPSLSIRARAANTKTDSISFTASAFKIPWDLELCEKQYLILGDSILAAFGYYNTFPYEMKKYSRKTGQSVRFSNMSRSGWSSLEHYYTYRGQGYSYPFLDGVIIELGNNDYSRFSGDYTQGYTYILEIVKEMQGVNPNLKVIIVSDTPAENDSRNSFLINNANQWKLSTLNNLNVINVNTAFDRKNLTNYQSSDAIGDHLHPSQIGHKAISLTVLNWLTSNNFIF